MPKRRDYGQFCPVAQTLDVIGDRWTILILRELLVGPVRYGGLLSALAPIATDVLARRLREMRAADLVDAVDGGYELTEAGAQLVPVLQAMAQWGTERLTPPAATTDLTAARAIQWLILSNRSGSSDVRLVEIRAGNITVTLTSTPYGYRARRGTVSDATADASVATDDTTLWAVLADRGRWAAARASGDLVVNGDEVVAQRLLAGRLPEPIAELLEP